MHEKVSLGRDINWTHQLSRGLCGVSLFRNFGYINYEMVNKIRISGDGAYGAPTVYSEDGPVAKFDKASSHRLYLNDLRRLAPKEGPLTVTVKFLHHSTISTTSGVIIDHGRGAALDGIGYSAQIKAADGKITIRARDDANAANVSRATSVAVNDGQWHTVSFLVDVKANLISIWLDGILCQGAQTNSFTGTSMTEIPYKVTIGCNNGGDAAYFFNGMISFIYWHRARFSNQEISLLHSEPFQMFDHCLFEGV